MCARSANSRGGANDIVIYVHDLRLFADMRVVYSLIWILSIAAHSVVAQEIRNDGVSMSVYFDNGFSSVDHGPDRRELDSLAQRLRALYIDDIISEITVKGWSSPNGLPENNVRLAEARARNTAEYRHPPLAFQGRGVRNRLVGDRKGRCGNDGHAVPRRGVASARRRFGPPQA